jgi:phenylacetate-CoA ligase
MTIRVERAMGVGPENDEALEAKVVRGIKREILVTARVDIVDHGCLPRSERKSKRVYDTRYE